MRQIRTSGSMSGRWKRSIMCHRATSRLYFDSRPANGQQLPEWSAAPLIDPLIFRGAHLFTILRTFLSNRRIKPLQNWKEVFRGRFPSSHCSNRASILCSKHQMAQITQLSPSCYKMLPTATSAQLFSSSLLPLVPCHQRNNHA